MTTETKTAFAADDPELSGLLGALWESTAEGSEITFRRSSIGPVRVLTIESSRYAGAKKVQVDHHVVVKELGLAADAEAMVSDCVRHNEEQVAEEAGRTFA
ncbi:hypothetical protein [Alienimonas sp. DA493]|uniref:hypothetical protein n=1 Tax=Alienimonas sp. DA493 TaxID=3373605 RepID=UPI0037544DE4